MVLWFGQLFENKNMTKKASFISFILYALFIGH